MLNPTVSYPIRRPRSVIRLSRFNYYQCVLRFLMDQYGCIYVQPFANYSIRHPRSVIRVGRFNHHSGGSRIS